MIRFKNPFHGVIESQENPNSRALRTTFLEKLKDTFFVIAGNRGIQQDEVTANDRINIEHPGLIDYITFQATRAVNMVTFWSWRNVFSEPIAMISIVPSILLSAGLNIVHYSLAAILTIFSTPIIGIVHIASQLSGGSKLKNEAAILKVTFSEECVTNSPHDNTLGEYIRTTGHTYNDIIIDLMENDCRSKETRTPHTLLIMEQKQKYNNRDCCKNGICTDQKGHIQFQVNLDTLQNEKDKLAVQALLKLNAGSLRNNLEDKGKLEEIKALISFPSKSP